MYSATNYLCFPPDESDIQAGISEAIVDFMINRGVESGTL